MKQNDKPIMFSREFWANSPLSIARHYGGIRYGGIRYQIMGALSDLVREDWIKFYQQHGREKVIEMSDNNIDDPRQAQAMIIEKSTKLPIDEPTLF